MYYTLVVNTIKVSTNMAVDTATVGCMSSDMSRGLNIMPPPTPTIDDSSPPKKDIVVTYIILFECH